MNNTTVSSLSKSIGLEVTNGYDSIGAIIFIVVVVLWYSSGVIFVMRMQMSAYQEMVEDSIGYPRKWFTQGFGEKNTNKRILGEADRFLEERKRFRLEELADKKKRDKLWDIYLGESTALNDRITRAEALRIRNIQRQLATIDSSNRNDHGRAQMMNDGDIVDLNVGSVRSDSMPNNRRLRERRGSSANQEILDDWKMAVCDLKIHKHWPWAIQKLLIRRHLRRQRRMSAYRSIRKQSSP